MKILTVLISLLMAAAVVYEIPKDKETIIIKAGKKGDVHFTHLEHSKMTDLDCVKCHGEQAKEGIFEACGPCHIKREQTISEKDAFHKFCIKCHKKSENDKAPVKCSECHKSKQG